VRGWLHHIAALNIFPAHEFWLGLHGAFRRTAHFEPDYLLGHLHDTPSVWFFPIAFLVKTPIPHLILILIGIPLTWTRAWRGRDWEIGATSIAAGCIFIAATVAVPHLGLRFILSVYVLLAIPAAQAAAALWDSRELYRTGRIVVAAAGIWAAAVVVNARSNYLGWFNEATNSTPEWFEISDDVTWFQNIGVLATALHERQAANIWLRLNDYPFPDELQRAGMPSYTALKPNTRVTGWVVIDLKESMRNSGYQWLREFAPVTIVAHAFAIYDLH
jgi:hypothetical protein